MSTLSDLLAQAIFAPPGTQSSVAQSPSSPVLWNLMQLLKQPQPSQHSSNPPIQRPSNPGVGTPSKNVPKHGGKH